MPRRGPLKVDWPTAAGALFFILMGGGFGGFGGWQLVTTYSFLNGAVPVTATVHEQRESCGDEGCTYWPDLALITPSGQDIILPTQFGASSYGYSEGSEVTVHYNPDYAYVRVSGGSELWLLGAGFFALGSLVFCLGIWLLLRWTVSRVSPSASSGD